MSKIKDHHHKRRAPSLKPKAAEPELPRGQEVSEPVAEQPAPEAPSEPEQLPDSEQEAA